MNKTKIDWCDMSWNPVTGCQHGCEYCYARKIATRFGGHDCDKNGDYIPREIAVGPQWLTEPKYVRRKGWVRKAPYPWFFLPTFHGYRLDEPTKIKKPQTIFVCSMADLFGDWVPKAWQQQVLQACINAPQHRYLFLTKAPNHVCQWPRFRGDQDYLEFDHDLTTKGLIRENIWMGVSFTGLKEDIPRKEQYHAEPWDIRAWYLGRIPVHHHGHKFMSVEPIRSDVAHLHTNEIDGCTKKPFKEYWFQDVTRRYEWIIVGAETGNHKGKVVPERSWVEHLASFCSSAGIPIFMKESLRTLMGADFVQEFPWD